MSLADRLLRVRDRRGCDLGICAVINYAIKYCLAATVTPTARGQDASRVSQPLSSMPNASCSSRTCAPIAAKSTWSTRPPANCCAPSQRGSPSCPATGRASAVAYSPNYSPANTRCCATSAPGTRVKSAQTNGVIERLSARSSTSTSTAGPVNNGDALAVEVSRFRQIYNTIRPTKPSTTATHATPTWPWLGHTGRALPQLVAAACQVGGLGGVARQLDGFVVRRA